MLGVVLVDARGHEPPSFHVCLPCDACISGGFSGCFSGFFWLVLVFLGRVQHELQFLIEGMFGCTSIFNMEAPYLTEMELKSEYEVVVR